jgi:hypothetical protein
MNTKRIFFGLATILVLMAAACTPNTADDDQVYEQSLDKKDVQIPKKN